MVVADRRGPGHDGDVRELCQLGERRGEPVPGGLAVDDDGGLGEQRAAGLVGLVHEHDRGAGAAGGEGGGEAGRAGADDQHVGMGEAAGVAVGVGLGGRDPEAGGVADHRLVDPVPEGARPHEGLVVEAGREQRSHAVVDRADVEGEAGPAVLAGRLEAVAQLLDGGAGVRLEAAGAAAGAHQRVRLVGAGGDHAARAVVLERAAHQVDAVGEQRRGQGVAGEAGVALAVEAEADRLRVVDAAAVREAVAGHSVPPVSVGEVGAGLARLVGEQEAVGDGLAHRVEEAGAAVDVAPALEVVAARVGADEEEVAPFLVGQLRRVGGPRDVRLARVGELELRAVLVAVGAMDQQHGLVLNARRRRRRLRRSAGRW